jgi:hypothetical protein
MVSVCSIFTMSKKRDVEVCDRENLALWEGVRGKKSCERKKMDEKKKTDKIQSWMLLLQWIIVVILFFYFTMNQHIFHDALQESAAISAWKVTSGVVDTNVSSAMTTISALNVTKAMQHRPVTRQSTLCSASSHAQCWKSLTAAVHRRGNFKASRVLIAARRDSAMQRCWSTSPRSIQVRKIPSNIQVSITNVAN